MMVIIFCHHFHVREAGIKLQQRPPVEIGPPKDSGSQVCGDEFKIIGLYEDRAVGHTVWQTDCGPNRRRDCVLVYCQAANAKVRLK